MPFCVCQEWNEIQFNGVYYEPPEAGAPGEVPTFETSYTFQYPRPKRPENLRIYECHVGMSSEEPKVSPASGKLSNLSPALSLHVKVRQLWCIFGRLSTCVTYRRSTHTWSLQRTCFRAFAAWATMQSS